MWMEEDEVGFHTRHEDIADLYLSLGISLESYQNGGNIKSIMDDAGKHLRFDAKLAKNIHLYIQHFVNKNPDHINALGSNMLGVYPMRFTPSDRIEWEEDILGLDPAHIRKQILALPHMDDVGKRATDTMNITCTWLTHKFFLSDLPLRAKEEAMKNCMVMMQYKLFSSLLQHYFPYPVDPNVAASVYSELSRKFDIKKYGTWKAVIDARAENIIAMGEIHEITIREYNDDIAIVKMIQDIQYRLRDKFKNIWEVLARVIAEDKKYGTTGSTMELDGKLVVRDLTRLAPTYNRYIHDVSMEKERFIKYDLIGVIESAMAAMPEKPFEVLLVAFHERCKKRDKDAMKLIDMVLEHLFNAVLSDRGTNAKLKDIAEVITRIRGLYTASRSSNDLLMELRELGEKIVKKDLKIVNEANTAALRTGLLLYIVLRTLSKEHYK